MKCEILPSRPNGKVAAPPSKSMAHRYLICGAMGEGSCVRGVSLSRDIEATLSCLKALGAHVEYENGCVRIGGFDPRNVPDGTSLYAHESGSTLRFLIPLCLLSVREITLTGADRLFERPLDIYENICREKGLLFEKDGSTLKVRGPLTSGEFFVPGNVSSQFISGLLFALPMTEGDSIIRITGDFESASYIDLTLSALRDFGVDIDHPDEKTFIIHGKSKLRSADITVEGDWSNGAFFEAMNYLGGDVTVEGLREDSLQGDRVYRDLFAKIKNKDFPIDISDCPDLAPILFAVSAAMGEGHFTGTRRLKIKESDRAEAMREELSKMGCDVTVLENEVLVKCEGLIAPKEIISGHNDHRIVMAMATLCTLTGGVIEGCEAVSKSFPDFFGKLSDLGIEVINHEDK